MAEENPSGSGSPGAVPKKETVRITLPSKPGDAPVVKRETVRLGVPASTPVVEDVRQSDDAMKGQTIRISPIPATPKKETTRVSTGPISPPAPPSAASTPGAPLSPPPSFSKPPFTPPGAPKAVPPLGPLPAVKPLAPAGMPPKPPGLASKPSGPMTPPGAPPKPAGSPPTVGLGAAPTPAVVVPLSPAGQAAAKAAPKKETARIQVAPPPGATMPKATVRMQQTQPLLPTAVPAISRAADRPSVAISDDSGGSDVALTVLSLLACVCSAAAAAMCYFAYTALNTLTQ